jgi:flavin reductase (DIM6/NTAB) family NADH-FMN oxidoreductase RutF
MKKDFSARPEKFTEPSCSWQDFLTAVPSLVFVVTGWKSNGKENACLQSWSAFVGGGKDEFACIMSAVSKNGHMYQSLKETGVCVLNFPSCDVYDRCIKTIGNNEFETDEITASGLTADKSAKVNAPRIKECFLNIECEFLWEHELFENNDFFGNQ